MRTRNGLDERGKPGLGGGEGEGIGTRLAARLPALIAAWRRSLSPEASGRRSAGSAAPLSREEMDRISAALLRLQRGLTGERHLAGARYMDDRELLGAYLLYYWPVSYLQASLSLALLAGSLGRPLRRVIDLGSGPGPAAAAFADAGAEELRLVDGSATALDLAREVLGRETGRVGFENRRLDGTGSPEAGSCDALVASHLLNELWGDREDRVDRRRDFIEAQAAGLGRGGILLVIEPALLATSRDALALRDALIDRGWRAVAPCPHSRPCPALHAGPGRSCHAEAEWDPPEPIASLARKAGLDRSSVKWSWYALTPPESRATGAVTSPSPPPPPGPAPDAGSLAAARVVSEGLLNKAGRLRYLLCSEGRLLTLSARADSAQARAMGFQDLRRHDLVAVEGGEVREGGLGLVGTSRLTLVGAAPRIGP